MSRRANKINRKSVSIQTKVKPINPEERVFHEEDVPHKAFGSIRLVVDGSIGKRVQFATNGLKIARNIPMFTQAAELPVTDKYVQFWRNAPWLDEEDNPIYSLQEAQSKAMQAYLGEAGPVRVITNDAFLLALMHYNDFTGDQPELPEEEEDDAERAIYGLPPAIKRDHRHPLERRLDYIHYMVLTDKDFGDALAEAVAKASEKAEEVGLWEASEEETEDGFQSETTE